MKSVILFSKGMRAFHRHHPWIFSGAIKRVNGQPKKGETVEIMDEKENVVGYGAFSPDSQIRVRVWSFNPTGIVGNEMISQRLEASFRLRESLVDTSVYNAYRLVHSEADGIPGLIVDRYGDILVIQFLSAGAEYYRNEIISSLSRLWPSKVIYERSDSASRNKEGLKSEKRLIAGTLPDKPVEIDENGVIFKVDIENGHKTGFYLDQRLNRELIRNMSHDMEILNCFSYTGGFGISALKGGAKHVVNIDTSAEANTQANINYSLNGFDKPSFDIITGDVFTLLRNFRADNRKFDMLILDPPKFADSKAMIPKAGRGYKDINMLGMQLLNKGGILVTFSCSGIIDADLFRIIVSEAATDTGTDAVILHHLHQSPDHTVTLNFPESAYLKGLVLKIA